MDKPIIGVVPLIDYGRESLWMLPGYFEGIAAAGGLPLMLPLSSDEGDLLQCLGLCDGLLFTGGQDVTPCEYGEEKTPLCGECSAERDKMERLIFSEAEKLDKPILGICRGIQLINVLLGGTLYQDLPAQHPSGVEHHQERPYDSPSHDVYIIHDSPLHELLGEDRIGVNSCHHQGIKTLATELEPMAIAPDGIIEAVFRPQSSFLWAVQWHPEFSYKVNPDSVSIFEAFVRSAK